MIILLHILKSKVLKMKKEPSSVFVCKKQICSFFYLVLNLFLEKDQQHLFVTYTSGN